MAGERLHTLEEAAAHFRVSKRTFRDFIGKHPFYRKLGRKILFSDADLRSLFDALDCPAEGVRGPHILHESEAQTLRTVRKLMEKGRKGKR